MLLLGPDMLPPDEMRNMTRDDSIPMTIGEYAEANDLQMAIVGISTAAAAEGAEDIVTSMDWHLKRTARWFSCSAARRRRAWAMRLKPRCYAA